MVFNLKKIALIIILFVIITAPTTLTNKKNIERGNKKLNVIKKIYISSGSNKNGIFTTKNKNIFFKQASNHQITIVGVTKIKGQTYYLVDPEIQLKKLIISNRVIPGHRIINWPEGALLNVKWYWIQAEKGSYKNGASKNWWAKIKYKAREIKKAQNKTTILLSTAFPDNYGTKRFQVRIVSLHGDTLSTPGPEATTRYGISSKVHRITIFQDSTLVGLIKGFYGLPYIWGSASPTGKTEDHQAAKFIGADCADLITAAARLKGLNISYTSSAGLRKYTKIIARKLKPKLFLYYDEKGNPVSTKTIKPGHLLFFKGHVAVFAKDTFIKGKLDIFDLMIDTAGNPPSTRAIIIGTIGWGSFDIGRLK